MAIANRVESFEHQKLTKCPSFFRSSPLLCCASSPLVFLPWVLCLSIPTLSSSSLASLSSPLLPSHLHIRGDINQSEVRMDKVEVVPLPLALALQSNDTGLSGPKAHSCYAWIPRSRACMKQNRTCRKASSPLSPHFFLDLQSCCCSKTPCARDNRYLKLRHHPSDFIPPFLRVNSTPYPSTPPIIRSSQCCCTCSMNGMGTLFTTTFVCPTLIFS